MRVTNRPAGLLSTEMSKKVRFLAMVADGEHPEDERLRTCSGAYLTATGGGLEAV